MHFGGQGVWHADGRQLQRLGLQPIVEVRPTLAGIRAGKGEVLDKAIEYLSHIPQFFLSSSCFPRLRRTI